MSGKKVIYGLYRVLFIILSFGMVNVDAATYYVKPTGNDNLSGLSEANAWQHVQKACTTLVAGDTVFIRSGSYSEDAATTTNIGGVIVNDGLSPANNGAAGNYIVLKGYPGDTRPIIRGLNGSASSGPYRSPALVDNKSYLIYDSLEFRGGRRGIFMTQGHDIIIRNCVIDSTLGPENNNNGGFVTFTSTYGAIRNIIVENCEIFANGQWIGSSPAYTSGGNTSGIHIYVCDSCEFRNNIVHDQEAGIHIKGEINDSTKHIKIYGNTIYNINDAALWVVHTGKQEDIAVYNNVVYNVDGAACYLHVGGGSDRRGVNVRIYNNTFDCGGVAAGIRSRFGNLDACSTFNNIIYNPGWNSGDYFAAHGFKNEGATPTNYYEDYNLYYGRSDGNYFVWPNGSGYTLSGWRGASDDGDHSTVENPLFTNAAAHDYTLQAGSPATSGGRGGAYPTYRGALGTSTPDVTGPVISGVASSSITNTSATITWSTNESSTSRVQYGTSISYGSFTSTNSSYVTSHSMGLSGLQASQTYHYRVISVDPSGNSSTGSDYTFTTAANPPADTTAPVISIVAASAITKNSATITWTTNESATSQVQYGKTGSYGSSTSYDGSLVISHSQNLSGLDSNTLYYYRVISQDGSGNQTTGGQYTFTTAATTLEEIGVGVTPVVSSSYTGYNSSILTDGTVDPYGGASTTWATNESPTEAHWIEINFGSNKTVNRICMCWAWNDYRSTWMTSQQYRIQTWNGSAFVDVQTVTPAVAGQSPVDLATPLVTSRMRIYQPANMGPTQYSTVMWLTEVEIFGSNEPGSDTTPPAAVTNLQGQ